MVVLGLRVMRNRSRIGKPWRVVEGHYSPTWWSRRPRWRTIRLLSEHATKLAARMARDEYQDAKGGVPS